MSMGNSELANLVVRITGDNRDAANKINETLQQYQRMIQAINRLEADPAAFRNFEQFKRSFREIENQGKRLSAELSKDLKEVWDVFKRGGADAARSTRVLGDMEKELRRLGTAAGMTSEELDAVFRGGAASARMFASAVDTAADQATHDLRAIERAADETRIALRNLQSLKAQGITPTAIPGVGQPGGPVAMPQIAAHTAETKKAEAALAGLTAQYHKTAASMGAYGTETAKTTTAVAANSKALKEQATGIEGVAYRMRLLGVGLTASITLPMVGASRAIIQTGSDFEDAMTNVEKVAEGTEADMQHLEDRFRNMAQVIPLSASAIANLAAEGAAMGVATGELVKFSDVAARMAAATNLGMEEAATSLAQFVNLTQGYTELTGENFESVGNVVVELGNKTAATEQQILRMSLRLAAAGTQVGLTQEEILALSATLASVGIRAEAGGSALSTVMVRMQTAVAEGGDQLAEFAEIAGMTSDTFAVLFQDDPAQALLRFVAGLDQARTAGENVFAVLEELDLDAIRVRDNTLRLANANELWAYSLGVANEELENQSALAEESGRRFETFSSQWQLVKNDASELAITLFQELRPGLITIFGLLHDGISVLDDVAQVFGELPGEIQAVVIGFGALFALLGPIVTMIGIMAPGWGLVTRAILGHTVAAAANTAVLEANTGALAGNTTAALANAGAHQTGAASTVAATTRAGGLLGMFRSLGPAIASAAIALGPWGIALAAVAVGIAAVITYFGAWDDIVGGAIAVGGVFGEMLYDNIKALALLAEWLGKLTAKPWKIEVDLPVVGDIDVGQVVQGAVLGPAYPAVKGAAAGVEAIGQANQAMEEAEARAGEVAAANKVWQQTVDDLVAAHGPFQDRLDQLIWTEQHAIPAANAARDAYLAQSDAQRQAAEGSTDFVVAKIQEQQAIERTNEAVTAAEDRLLRYTRILEITGAKEAELRARQVSGYNEILQAVTQMTDGGIGAFEVLLSGITGDVIEMEDAIDAFASNSNFSLDALIQKANEMRIELELDRIAALALGDVDTAAQLETQITAIENFVTRAKSAFASLAEAPDAVITASQGVELAIQQAGAQVDIWSQKNARAKAALDLLAEAEERQGGLTEEQTAQREVLLGMLDRTAGGMQDLQGEVVAATVAEGMLLQELDALNEAYPEAERNSDAYREAVNQVYQKYDPLISSQGELQESFEKGADAIGIAVRQMIDLYHTLGLLTDEEYQILIGADDTATEDIENNLLPAIDEIPESTYVPIYAQDNVSSVIDEEITPTIDQLTGAEWTVNIGVEFEAPGDPLAPENMPGYIQGVDVPPVVPTVDNSQLEAGLAESSEMVGEFIGPPMPYEAIIGANDDLVGSTVVEAKATVDAFIGPPYNANIGADASPVYTVVQNAQTAIHALTGESYTVHIGADASAAYAVIEGLAQYLPESPAEEGPLSIQPDFSYVTDDMAVQIQPGLDGATELMAASFPVGKQPEEGALSRPIDWTWLFEGIDMAAEDAGERVRDAVVGWLTGINVDQLISGELVEGIEDKLADLLTLRQAAVEAGVGAEYIAELDKQIRAAEAELAAIGQLVGTEIIQGIIDETAKEEAFKAAIDNIRTAFERADFSAEDLIDFESFSGNINDEIDRLTAMRNAALQAGLPELAAEYDAELALLYEQRRVLFEIWNTPAMQEYIERQREVTEEMRKQEEHAEAVARMQELQQTAGVDLANALAAGGDTLADFINTVRTNYDEAKQALDFAKLLGLPPEVIADLQKQYDEAAAIFHTIFGPDGPLTEAMEAGLIDEETLQALAEMGGEWFDIWYDSIFGEGAAERLREGWSTISDESLEALRALKPELEDMGADWINTIVDGFTSGRLTLAQAMELMTDDMGNMSDEAKIALLELVDVYRNDLVQALASGEGVEAAQAQWDAFMRMLEQIALASGMTVEELLADWERLEAEANETAQHVAASLDGQAVHANATSDQVVSGHAEQIASLIRLRTAWRDTMQEIMKVVEVATGQVGDYFDGLQNDIDDLSGVSGLGGVLGDVPEDIKEQLAEILPLMSDGGAAMMGEFVDAAAEGVLSVADILEALAGVSDDKITGVIESLIEEAQRLEQEYISALLAGEDTDEIVERIDLVGELLGSLGERIDMDPTAIEDEWSIYGDAVIDGFLMPIRQGAEDAHEAGVDLGLALIDGTKQALDIQSPSGEYIDMGHLVIDGFEQGLKERLIDLLAVLYQMRLDMLEIFRPMPDLLGEIAELAVISMTDQLLAHLEEAYAASHQLAEAIQDGFEDAMEIDSPSKVFMGYADDVYDGFTQQLERNFGSNPLFSMPVDSLVRVEASPDSQQPTNVHVDNVITLDSEPIAAKTESRIMRFNRPLR